MLSYIQMKNIDQDLKIIKEKTGFTMKDIAKEVGISERTIRRWVKGINKPHPLHFREFKKVIERIKNFYTERGIKV